MRDFFERSKARGLIIGAARLHIRLFLNESVPVVLAQLECGRCNRGLRKSELPEGAGINPPGFKLKGARLSAI